MERKRAWITAATVSVCLATGSLAVMANTGLLTSKPSTDPIGTLAPGDITIEATENLLDAETSVETSVEAPTSVVIRYEDVYVIDDPLVTVPTPEPTEARSSEVEVTVSGAGAGFSRTHAADPFHCEEGHARHRRRRRMEWRP